jgi:hypothetical protein
LPQVNDVDIPSQAFQGPGNGSGMLRGRVRLACKGNQYLSGHGWEISRNGDKTLPFAYVSLLELWIDASFSE